MLIMFQSAHIRYYAGIWSCSIPGGLLTEEVLVEAR